MAETQPPSQRIAVLVTMDTKFRPAMDLVDRIEHSGRDAVIVDLSVGALRPPAEGVIGAAEVAAAASVQWESLRSGSREAALSTVARGAARVLGDLHVRGDLAGVVALGGGSGSWVAQTVMAALPPGVPKLIVSTSTRNDGRQSDIVFMASPVDIEGSNALLDVVLDRAAATICALAATPGAAEGTSTLIAMTMFGVTTEGGSLVRTALEHAGYEVAVFHANGMGGRELERLIAEGRFAGVMDWTTTEVIDHVSGGLCDAGPDRLKAAASVGIPQVVVPGAMDVINIDGSNTSFGDDRIIHEHVPGVLLVRSNAEENRAAARFIGSRLRHARAAATRVLIPDGGYSALDVPGVQFHDPAADGAFADALIDELGGRIEVVRRPEHINSRDFAAFAAAELLGLIEAHPAEKEESTEVGEG